MKRACSGYIMFWVCACFDLFLMWRNSLLWPFSWLHQRVLVSFVLIFWYFKLKGLPCVQCEWMISSSNKSSTSFCQGRLKVIHLSGSIFLALCCWVAFPICEESHFVQYTACLGTTARHSDKSQHRETELYLHSASIHFWSCRFGIEFFSLLLPALSFSAVRGYDLRAVYLFCFFGLLQFV